MATSECVILYGESVFLAGIRAELAGRSRLDVLTLAPGDPDASAFIRARQPAALLFDLSAAQPDFAVALLRDWPDLILIGVDPSSDKLLVLSGSHEQPVSVAEFVRAVIRGRASLEVFSR